MDSVTSLLILTSILCLCVTAVYFYSYRLSTIVNNTDSSSEHSSIIVLTKIAPALSILAFALYFWQLFINVFSAQLNFGQIRLSAGLAIGIIGFIYLLCTLYYQFVSKQRNNPRLWVIIGMLALLSAISSLGFYFNHSPFALDQSGWALYLHLFLSLTAYALLSLALLFALLQFWRSRQLRNLELNDGTLPNLEFLENESFRWLSIGFVLLTIALLTGFFFLYDLRAQHLPHKVILSIISWVIFATLIIGRYWLGWRGKKALKWVLSGFIILALAYFGSKIVLEVFLDRSWQ